jgi:predicted Ser/Thr protein kinase/tetratricopeptide (TPR) repeat protein
VNTQHIENSADFADNAVITLESMANSKPSQLDPALRDTETPSPAGAGGRLQAFDSPVERELLREGVHAALFGEPAPGPALAPQIGRFAILRKLGEGGMGVVYVGYDERLDRRAAIKLVHTRRDDARARERMLREAQALARISHPNVVQIYESGEYGEGLYIAMELVEGSTLREWLAEAPRSLAELREVFVAAARGLAAAHAKGLTHRDFKPENVMIDREGRVRVMDFGLVRAQGASRDDEGEGEEAGELGETRDLLSQTLTRTGARMGTPAYMAPEQHLGRATDARSDQFSFCVALWEAIYGRRPFAGETLAMLTVNVLEGRRDEPPSRAEVPRALRAVLERGLATEPEARWPSMDALIEAISGAFSAEGRRRRRIFAGAVLASLALLGGLAWGFVERREQAALDACSEDARSLDGQWNDATRARLRQAFVDSGAVLPTVSWGLSERRLDDYVQRWSHEREAACRAQLDEEDELAPRRVACLERRRASFEAMLELLEGGDPRVVAEASIATAELPSLDDCNDEDRLALLPPPLPEYDPARVEAVERALARLEAFELAELHEAGLREAEAALAEAEAIGWDRLVAAAQLHRGRMLAGLRRAEEAREALELAEATGGPLVELQAATALTVVVGIMLGDEKEGRLWSRRADARVRDHDLHGSREHAEQLEAATQFEVEHGDYELALAHIADAKRIHMTHTNTVGMCRMDLAELELHAARGQAEEAQGPLSVLTLACEGIWGIAHPRLAEARMLGAELDLEHGIPARATVHLVLAERYFEELPEGAEWARYSFAQARAKWAAGSHEEALEHARDAVSGYAAAGDHEAVAEVEAWLAEHSEIPEPESELLLPEPEAG